MSKFCTSCGATLGLNARFCVACATPVKAQQSVAAGSVASTPPAGPKPRTGNGPLYVAVGVMAAIAMGGAGYWAWWAKKQAAEAQAKQTEDTRLAEETRKREMALRGEQEQRQKLKEKEPQPGAPGAETLAARPQKPEASPDAVGKAAVASPPKAIDAPTAVAPKQEKKPAVARMAGPPTATKQVLASQPAAVDNSAATAELLRQARGAMDAKRYQEAIAVGRSVLAIDSGNQAARQLVQQASEAQRRDLESVEIK
jgi:hypothetical protein